MPNSFCKPAYLHLFREVKRIKSKKRKRKRKKKNLSIDITILCGKLRKSLPVGKKTVTVIINPHSERLLCAFNKMVL